MAGSGGTESELTSPDTRCGLPLGRVWAEPGRVWAEPRRGRRVAQQASLLPGPGSWLWNGAGRLLRCWCQEGASGRGRAGLGRRGGGGGKAFCTDRFTEQMDSTEVPRLLLLVFYYLQPRSSSPPGPPGEQRTFKVGQKYGASHLLIPPQSNLLHTPSKPHHIEGTEAPGDLLKDIG